MQANILSYYSVILPLQVILLSDVTLVSAFHVQGNILSGFLAILPSQVILPSCDVIAVSAVAAVRSRYNKTMLPLYEGNMMTCSPSTVNFITCLG